MLNNAKLMAFRRWANTLNYLNSRKKCVDYGHGETADKLWEKLPQPSKDYWLERAGHV